MIEGTKMKKSTEMKIHKVKFSIVTLVDETKLLFKRIV